MSLRLHSHPFASFCQKVLIALYENTTPFEAFLVDLANPAERAALAKLWPFAQFPVLQDSARAATVPESTIIIEYLALHYPGPAELIPADPELARETRLLDRFYDLRVGEPMQKIVGDRLRPPGKGDPTGVEQAQAALRTAYTMIEKWSATKTWAMGDAFSMADCAAAPALYYADLVLPLGDTHPNASAYLRRLCARPSYARVLREAEPYLPLFPKPR